MTILVITTTKKNWIRFSLKARTNKKFIALLDWLDKARFSAHKNTNTKF